MFRLPAMREEWTPATLRAGAGAGVAAGAAYLVAQALDLRLFPTRTDDLAIHGRLLSADARWWRIGGAVLHCGFGAVVGAVYAGWPRRRLTAVLPPWAAGVTFLQIENTALYPLLLVLQRWHPAWHDGTLESYFGPLPYAQQVFRHLAFGAVLGILLGKGLGQSPSSRRALPPTMASNAAGEGHASRSTGRL
jgi:hypothetical protein